MNNQIIFWILWFAISSWTVKTFYFSYQKRKLERLRLTTFGIDLSVLVLFFLPWLPYSLGGKTAFQIILEGNPAVALLFTMVAVSAILFLVKKEKIGVCLHIALSVFFIAVMVWLTPKNYFITIREIAPVLAALLLLIGNVTGLLLLHQVQLRGKLKNLKT